MAGTSGFGIWGYLYIPCQHVCYRRRSLRLLGKPPSASSDSSRMFATARQRPCLCQRGFISRGAGPELAAHLHGVRLGHRKAFHTKVSAWGAATGSTHKWKVPLVWAPLLPPLLWPSWALWQPMTFPWHFPRACLCFPEMIWRLWPHDFIQLFLC